MNKGFISSIIFFTVIWIIMCEKFTISTVLTGTIVSSCSFYFCYNFLPLYKISNVSFLRLAIYPFYLIGQIYLSGFSTIKLMLTRASAEVVEIRTELDNDFLRALLANSITLNPGSISLDLKDNIITVLYFKSVSKNTCHSDDADELIKGKLERMLLKAQK